MSRPLPLPGGRPRPALSHSRAAARLRRLGLLHAYFASSASTGRGGLLGHPRRDLA